MIGIMISFIDFFIRKNCSTTNDSSNWLKLGAVVHCYMVDCLLSQNFCHSCFLGKFSPKIWHSSNWLEFGTGVHCHMLIRILMFIFSKLLSFIFFWANLVPKSEVLQTDQNLVQGYINYYTLISVLMFIFSKIFLFI